MAPPKGHPRYGGVRKGYKHPKTIEKALERERLRSIIEAEMEPMTKAQIEHAKGVKYMVLRKRDGSFARATDEAQLNAAVAAGEQAFQIFTQAPNTQAYADLMNRYLDKPAEQLKVTGEDDGPVKFEFVWKRKKAE